MANKLSFQASEFLFNKGENPPLLKNIAEFKKRNIIVKNQCCPSCLKAHLFKISQEIKVSKKIVDSLISNIDAEIGHNGYYLDVDKLIKI